MLELAGDSAIDVTVRVTVPTLRVAMPLMPFREAVIVVDPDSTAVASPLALIVATVGVPDAQLAVALTSVVVLSLYFAVALNCCVSPGPTLALGGVTEIEISVFAGGGSPLAFAGNP